MRWSKVRKLVEDSFAESVCGRVTVHSTTYGRSRKVTGRIEVDKSPLASFDDRIAYTLLGATYYSPWPHAHHKGAAQCAECGGLFGRAFNRACWDYLHSSVNGSLRSENPLIRSLACLNAKVGRRRLAEFIRNETHPLPSALAQFRAGAEKARTQPATPAAP